MHRLPGLASMQLVCTQLNFGCAELTALKDAYVSLLPVRLQLLHLKLKTLQTPG